MIVKVPVSARLDAELVAFLHGVRGSRGLGSRSGALELAFGQKMAAANEQVMLLWVSVKNLAISIGQPLLGALSGAAAWLAKVLHGVTEFTKAHPILGKVIGVTLAVVNQVVSPELSPVATSTKRRHGSTPTPTTEVATMTAPPAAAPSRARQ